MTPQKGLLVRQIQPTIQGYLALNTYWLLDQYFHSIGVLLWNVNLSGSDKAYLHVKQLC